MKGRGGALCFLCVLLCKSIQLESEQEEAEKAEGSLKPRRAPHDRKTGFQPVREDSASRLSADETTGWKPVGPDRRPAQYWQF